MQSMDKNTIIGFVLLAVLLFAYMFIASKNSKELEAQKRRYDDSVAVVTARKQAVAAKTDSNKTAAVIDTSAQGKLFNGSEKTLLAENEVLKIVFSNKGGQAKSVQLKQFRSFD